MVVLMSACVCRTRTQVTVFGVQLDSLEISVSANAEKRADFIPKFLKHIFWTASKVHENDYKT